MYPLSFKLKYHSIPLSTTELWEVCGILILSQFFAVSTYYKEMVKMKDKFIVSKSIGVLEILATGNYETDRVIVTIVDGFSNSVTFEITVAEWQIFNQMN